MLLPFLTHPDFLSVHLLHICSYCHGFTSLMGVVHKYMRCKFSVFIPNYLIPVTISDIIERQNEKLLFLYYYNI
jgi:hypothetical protein